MMLLPFLFLGAALAQTLGESDGYTGYSLTLRDTSDGSVHYKTENTNVPPGADLSGPPDVYLNANVNVGQIFLEVENLTAQVNIAASVLSLLKFNAGVDLSIDSVTLDIQNVSASVTLEARLGNLVRMINDTLDSIDLNPILANLGNTIGEVINDTAGAVGAATNSKRSEDFLLEQGILYSVNSYTQDTHTNYVLSQSGDIVAQSLHNDGSIYGKEVVGSYWHDMTPNGHEFTVVLDGRQVHVKEYVYEPHVGLEIIAAIYLDGGNVIKTAILAESGAQTSSTIAGDL